LENFVVATTDFTEALLDNHLLVDVRSPLEFEEDHLPGALNVPLLDNGERATIGIIHKNDGPVAARRRGLELTAARFPAMVATIVAAADGRPIIVYCWRGGLRSKTVTTILDLSGVPATQLNGGYKAYRTRVAAYFAPFRPPGPLVVLHGLTGIGKTDLLHHLRDNNSATIDLEGLAGHRGSAFGALGLSQTLSQKRFESLLWDAFRRCPKNKPIIIEGESRRIGKVSLPGDLYEVMREGIKIWCHAELETRVARLIAEYGKSEYREAMSVALQRISKKLGGEIYQELAWYLEQWNLEQFMAGLLHYYYDRVYYKTRSWQEDWKLSLEDYATAGSELANFLKQRFPD
jgi:tRNA 2-selenouridine synthase